MDDKPGVNHSLVGQVHLYAVEPVAASVGLRPFQKVEYSRVAIRFSGLQTDESEIRLPVSFMRNLSVSNESGDKIEVFKGPDGFAYVKNDGSFKDLSVSSFSLVAIMPLMAPLFGLLPLCFVRRRKGVAE